MYRVICLLFGCLFLANALFFPILDSYLNTLKIGYDVPWQVVLVIVASVVFAYVLLDISRGEQAPVSKNDDR